jgi:hypothetical protein
LASGSPAHLGKTLEVVDVGEVVREHDALSFPVSNLILRNSIPLPGSVFEYGLEIQPAAFAVAHDQIALLAF